jgi:hypothetical protein
MLILESHIETEEEKKLVLGDYITVHVAETHEIQKLADVTVITSLQSKHEAFFQRIQKERGDLNDVRLRGAA